MRTLFTSYDIKEIIRQIFNGNLELHKATNVEYENPNSEKILLIDEENGEKQEKDLADYLNIKFYSWKNRLVEKSDHSFNEPPISGYEDWLASLNFSMNESYALVELLDEEVTASQDIDGATKIGRITFLVQADKITNLDYYISKIRNTYLGNPQDIQNSYGDIIKAYITMGILLYDEEPSTIQLGECVKVSCNFRISYLTNALTYNDTKVEISLDGDDIYDQDGNIVDAEGNPTTTKYLTMPLTKMTWQNIFNSTAIPKSQRPDLTGFLVNSLSLVKTLSFYDFNKELIKKFNKVFWGQSAYLIDNKITGTKEVNIPVFIRITSDGHSYVYKDVIDNMQKTITNNDFNISSITLKGWGKDYTEPNILLKLSFDSDGGSEEEPMNVFYKTAIGELPTPTKSGYVFLGWFIDDEKITDNMIWNYTENKTAVAVWGVL